MPLTYVKHEPISLHKHEDFSEVWLHDRIAQDTGILGLGELDVIQREKVQFAGGRLDLLLANAEDGVRYEVEIMLGATDPSHIIRCIEYWDIERRRYPAYDHVAVLVAEDITTRFLNVMSLLAGSIPLIAIQLNALQVGNQIVLNFTKVLDQRQLREDDATEGDGQVVTRAEWEEKVGAGIMQICDQITKIANDSANQKLSLKYKKSHIGLCFDGQPANYIVFWPKRKFVAMRFQMSEIDVWRDKADKAKLDPSIRQGNRLLVRIASEDLKKPETESLLREMLETVVKEKEE